tara:strand:+ start:248 stop:1072 length:825 start_codon:yes stop_codon:yes gene_type:complete
MVELLLVIYSHTDYLDILAVANSFLTKNNNKILLINIEFKKIMEEHPHIRESMKSWKQIIYYSDDMQYGSRMFCLNSISDDYFIFMHETDVLVKYDINILNKLKCYMTENDIDKIELQHCAWPPSKTPLKQTYNSNNKEISFAENCNLYKISNPDFFVYNVNPTLWKSKSLLKIMNNFKNHSYRNMEKKEVQIFTANNFNCLSLKCKKYVKCGYFTCPEFFQYIHITHYGKLVRIDNCPDLTDEIKKIFIDEIYKKFLIHSRRPWRTINDFRYN